MNRPETLDSALEGAHGVFAVTNFWEPGGVDEIKQAGAVIQEHSYLGANADDQIALANKLAGKPATDFATWARNSMPAIDSDAATTGIATQ